MSGIKEIQEQRVDFGPKNEEVDFSVFTNDFLAELASQAKEIVPRGVELDSLQRESVVYNWPEDF